MHYLKEKDNGEVLLEKLCENGFILSQDMEDDVVALCAARCTMSFMEFIARLKSIQAEYDEIPYA